jgi:hypothetical protein
LGFAIRQGGAIPRPLGLLGRHRHRDRRANAILAALLGALLSGSALGHEGSARLVVEPAQVRPGGVLTIRVEDLPPERTTALSLSGTGGSVPLASMVVDPEGHATIFVEVPADLPLGSYDVTAEADGIAVASAPLSVQGQPITTAGEPGAKDEDDTLLIALPSGWQQSLSGPIVTARPLTETLPAGSGSRASSEGFVELIVLVVGIGSVLPVVWSRLRRRADRTGG